MGDKEQGVFVLSQNFFHRLQGGQVEIVGRLVKNQQVKTIPDASYDAKSATSSEPHTYAVKYASILEKDVS